MNCPDVTYIIYYLQYLSYYYIIRLSVLSVILHPSLVSFDLQPLTTFLTAPYLSVILSVNCQLRR